MHHLVICPTVSRHPLVPPLTSAGKFSRLHEVHVKADLVIGEHLPVSVGNLLATVVVVDDDDDDDDVVAAAVVEGGRRGGGEDEHAQFCFQMRNSSGKHSRRTVYAYRSLIAVRLFLRVRACVCCNIIAASIKLENPVI